MTSAGTVNVDATGYLAALRGWWPKAKKTLPELLAEEGNLMAEALMMFTPPFAAGGGGGLRPGARARAAKVIESETKRVFRPLWEIPMNVIAHADDLSMFLKLKAAGRFKGKSDLMRKLLKDKDPADAYARLQRLMKNRPPTGNPLRTVAPSINKETRNRERVKGRLKMSNHNKVFYLENARSIKDANAAVQKDIGMMKAQWAYAARQVSGKLPRLTPKWCLSQPSFAAKGKNDLNNNVSPTLTFTNLVGNRWHLGDKFNTVQAAFNLREKKLFAKLKGWSAKQAITI